MLKNVILNKHYFFMNRDWWKWGNPKETKHINDYPKLKTMVEERWKINLRENFFPPKKFDLPVLTEKRKEESCSNWN